MLGKIVSVKNGIVYVQLSIDVYQEDNLMGKNVTFGDRYIGEVTAIYNSMLEVSLIGEILSSKFIPGSVNMPPFNSTCRLTTLEEVNTIYGIDNNRNVIKIGKSFIYNDYNVCLNVDSFFSNHFSIFGNTGSGKSHFVARLLQGIFYDSKKL